MYLSTFDHKIRFSNYFGGHLVLKFNFYGFKNNNLAWQIPESDFLHQSTLEECVCQHLLKKHDISIILAAILFFLKTFQD
jgi:hypothetical protein